MNTKQQREVLKYFDRSACDWKRKANISMIDEVNVIKQRNDYVVRIINRRKKTQSFLDIGCGTGDLVCEIAQKGIKSIGVDFANEMIKIAKNNAKISLSKHAEFECCSIFDYSSMTNKYDVISAIGFIEYITYQQFDKLLVDLYKSLRKSGSLVLGSRNRLLNLFSLNKYTEEEINEANTDMLLREAIKIVKENNIKNLVGFKTATLQKKDKTHQKTGINVSTRYQYTPVQLINILADKGFVPVEIYPIHIHGVPPVFKNAHPDIHGRISNLLQNYTENNMCLIPQSSSFMIHVMKR